MTEAANRPWGRYKVLAEEARYKVKSITVEPGKRLSYQFHRNRSEHWFVISGRGIVTVDGDERLVAEGDTVDVPVGMAHRVENSGTVPLVFIEVQHGESFDEDDIVRLHDDYGRADEARQAQT